MAIRILTLTTRHFSRHELAQRLEASVSDAEVLLDGEEGELWAQEAAVLCHFDLYLDHVKFTELQPLGGLERLRVDGIMQYNDDFAAVVSFRL